MLATDPFIGFNERIKNLTADALTIDLPELSLFWEPTPDSPSAPIPSNAAINVS